MDAAPTPTPPQRRTRRALPWLLWLLTLSALVAVLAAALQKHADDRDELESSRDEAADLRRRLLIAEDRMLAAERKLAAPRPSPSPRP